MRAIRPFSTFHSSHQECCGGGTELLPVICGYQGEGLRKLARAPESPITMGQSF